MSRSGSDRNFFQKPGRCIVFAGKGLCNAGDALFAAQCLERVMENRSASRFQSSVDCSDLMRSRGLCRRPPEIVGADVIGKWRTPVGHHAFGNSRRTTQIRATARQNATADRNVFGTVVAPLVILDGLLGVGARPRAPRADPRRLSRHQSTVNNKGRLRLCGGSSNWSRYRFRQQIATA